jgi:serine/threonine-protein kinase
MSRSEIVELDSTEFTKRYKVIAKLGEGGMAVVHLAVVRGVAGVRKLVVLKSMRPEFVGDQKICNMFLAEARLAATLTHPNIVQTFEVVISKQRPMLVMEYMDGQPLIRVLPLAALPLSHVLLILKDVLQGLDYAHSFTDIDGTPLNLVHRDVSPQNVFVTYDGQVKLLDFGIAKIVGTSGQTETGEIKGKVRYMAPEQMLGSAQIDRRADVFSVGVLLWEAVTRRRIWEGVADVQVIQSVLGGQLPAPSTVSPDVPPVLDAICRQALAHDVADRYPTAAAMLADIEAAVEQLGARTTNRRVGQFVTEAFADLRTSVRSVIESQLRDDKSTPVTLVVSERDDAILTQGASGAGPAALSPLHTLNVSARSRRGRPWKLGVATGLAAAGVALAAGLLVHPRSGETGPTSRSAASPEGTLGVPATAAQVAASPAAGSSDGPATSVALTLTATPEQAQLFLDDQPLGANPFHGERSRDRVVHELRVEAPGYRSQTVAVTLSAPLDLRIDLQATSFGAATHVQAGSSSSYAADSASPPSKSDASAEAVTDAAPSAPIENCTPPFYIDDVGIKRFKPGCLK